MDSVALTDVLSSLCRTGDIAAQIVHIDHGVREDSAAAADLVEAFATSLGLPFHLRRLSPDVLGRHPGVGIEEALRRERYRAVADVAVSIGADAIAVGHHQRDQAETVLLHLIRGAGLAGASGMREWSDFDVPWWLRDEPRTRLRVWRPFLAEPYSVIQTWHESQGLPLAEDETNANHTFRRNAIRHDILPRLESIMPGSTGNLARFAELAAVDDASLQRLAGEILGTRNAGTLDRAVLMHLDVALQRRIVRQWLETHRFDGELSLDRIDAVCELARRNRSGAVVEIGAGWHVRIDRGVLSVRLAKRVP